jgi:NAD(P)-dependent dehydrogenase (short-subunit alcohol dehydrogenase family)
VTPGHNCVLFGCDGSIGERLCGLLRSQGSAWDKNLLTVGVDEGDRTYTFSPNRVYDDNAEIMLAFEQAESYFGGLPDLVVVNIGVTHIQEIEHYDIDAYLRVMYLNTVIPYEIARRYVVMLRKVQRAICDPAGRAHGTASRRRPRVVFSVSMASNKPMRQCYAYPASKAALEMTIRSLAREFSGPDGVDFFGVSPCGVQGSAMIEHAAERVAALRGVSVEAARSKIEHDLPIGRLASIEEVAALFNFACFQAPPACSGSIFRMSAGGE